MRLLDLFCGQGGAGWGYHLAGWEVVGVDINPQPKYPLPIVQTDAWWFLEAFGKTFDAIHASPPCQAHTKAAPIRSRPHQNLIPGTRERLQAAGVPYIIENVTGAVRELRDPSLLCGTMFGLPLYRHRLFETSFPVTPPLHGEHWLPVGKLGRPPGANEIHQPVGNFSNIQRAREDMQMPWANRDGLREAVPPAYTKFLGELIMPVLHL